VRLGAQGLVWAVSVIGFACSSASSESVNWAVRIFVLAYRLLGGTRSFDGVLDWMVSRVRARVRWSFIEIFAVEIWGWDALGS